MPKFICRRSAAIALGASLAIGGTAALPAAASASSSQVAIIQDFGDLTNPVGIMQQFRMLGRRHRARHRPLVADRPEPRVDRKAQLQRH